MNNFTGLASQDSLEKLGIKHIDMIDPENSVNDEENRLLIDTSKELVSSRRKNIAKACQDHSVMSINQNALKHRVIKSCGSRENELILLPVSNQTQECIPERLSEECEIGRAHV